MIDLSKYRDPKLIQRIVEDLQNWNKPIKIMEVCGSHTMAIGHWGIRKLLPKNISLISGPGCPVCVTDQGYIDTVLQLAERDDCLVATYGDMIRVPGKDGSLETKQPDRNVKVVLRRSTTSKYYA